MMLRKVAITGPESTGKSSLSQNLANHFKCDWVGEYARSYLEARNNTYKEEDLIHIARAQLASEESKSKDADRLLFCDSEMLVMKIWSDYVFKRCDPFIEQMLEQQQYALYLLCAPDLPWEDDPLRSNPHNRDFLFNRYQEILESRKLNYRIIRGLGNQRVLNAVSFVEELLNETAL